MKVSKPGLSTFSLYLPTWTKSNRYEPSAAVVVPRAMPVSVLVRVTLAPGTTPPDWSVTVPRREALVWPQAEPLRTARNETKHANCSSARRNLTPHLRCVVRTLAQDARRVECLGPFSWKKCRATVSPCD